jgi:hypothetical protein
MLEFAGGIDGDRNKIQKAARDMINFLSRWDEFIAISSVDLDYLEDVWTGDTKPQNPNSVSSETTFYTLLEYCTYMQIDWILVKEISYIAVTAEALEVLFQYADFAKPPEDLGSLQQKARACDHEVWRNTIECLRLGSPWQHFSAAVSCTLVSLYSLPLQKRSDYVPITEAIGFASIPESQILNTITKYHKFGEKKLVPKRLRKRLVEMSQGTATCLLLRDNRKDVVPKEEELTFIRNLTRKQWTSIQQGHNVQNCERCYLVGQKFEQVHDFRKIDESTISGYGLALVQTLNTQVYPFDTHDFCLFGFDVMPELSDNLALSVAVEDLLQNGSIFHTIALPLSQRFTKAVLLEKDMLFNLPQPYRPADPKEHEDCRKWILELQGKANPLDSRPPSPDELRRPFQDHYWTNLQLLLHFLNQGSTWADSCAMVQVLQDEQKDREYLYHLYQCLADEAKRMLLESDLPPGARKVGNCISYSVRYLGPRFSARGARIWREA